VAGQYQPTLMSTPHIYSRASFFQIEKTLSLNFETKIHNCVIHDLELVFSNIGKASVHCLSRHGIALLKNDSALAIFKSHICVCQQAVNGDLTVVSRSVWKVCIPDT